MKRIAVLAVLLCLGCGQSYVIDDAAKPHVPPAPVVEPVTGQAVFSVLATKVPGQIRNTRQLARIVNLCGLNADDVAKFDQAFPEAASKERELTAADAAILKGLK